MVPQAVQQEAARQPELVSPASPRCKDSVCANSTGPGGAWHPLPRASSAIRARLQELQGMARAQGAPHTSSRSVATNMPGIAHSPALWEGQGCRGHTQIRQKTGRGGKNVVAPRMDLCTVWCWCVNLGQGDMLQEMHH